jgi:3-oxoacyl-[acyl-carrier protein] reductase
VDLGIAGRRAAVAAGTAGLGLATAQALVDEGVRVAVCGRDRQRLDAALEQLGAQAVGVVADLATPGAAATFVDEAQAALGGALDIVVANAGGPPPGAPSRTSLDGFRAALELNFLATVDLVHAALPSMRANGWGRVLAITSIGARQPIPMLAASTSARAATTAFIKNLATEVAADGVTANTIQPGSHRTARMEQLGGEHLEETLRGIPAGRLGDAADFGAVAAFLCSERAAFVCGASLVVDGGASKGLQ